MAKQQRWRRGGTTGEQPPSEPVEARPATSREPDSGTDDGVVEARPRPATRPTEEPAAKPATPAPAGTTTGTTASTTTGTTAGTTAGTASTDAAPPTLKKATPQETTPQETAPERAAKPAGPAPARSTPPSAEERSAAARLRLSILDSAPVTLVMAAHPRQALLTGLGMGVAALAAGRPNREAAVVAATALVGQTILGWHNDIVDRDRDARHQVPRKPVAEGRLETGSVWYAIIVAVLLVVPLSISTGVTAGSYYLVALAIGLLGNVALRKGKLSWVTWAASFALYPAYLSYGGWGGGAEGSAPEVPIVVLAALLGIGVHVVRSVWGLVPDDADGWSHLPLVLGRRIGATRLLALAGTWTAVIVVLTAIVGSSVGLRQ